MDGPCKNLLVLNIIFVINTIVMGVFVGQLWVVRSRFDRFDLVAGRIGCRVQTVVQQIGRAVEWVTSRR